MRSRKPKCVGRIYTQHDKDFIKFVTDYNKDKPTRHKKEFKEIFQHAVSTFLMPVKYGKMLLRF